MRLIKMIGLAAMATAAILAVVGAATASAAAHEQIGLCKKETLLLCAAGDIIPWNSGTLLAKAGKGEFKGGLITETCESSMGKGVIEGGEDQKLVLKGKITELTFTGCSPCKKVVVNGIPLAVEIKMKTVGNETEPWEIVAPGSATFSECTFGASCKFGGTNIKALIEMVGGEAVMNTNGTELKLQEGSEFLCGSTGKWFSKYKLRWTLTAGGAEDLVFPTLLGTA